MTSSAIRLAAGQFLGDITRSLDVCDLLLRETRHHGGHAIAPHVHETPHFCSGRRISQPTIASSGRTKASSATRLGS